MSDELDDVLNAVMGMANIFSDVANSQLQYAKAESAAKNKEKLAERAFQINEQNAMIKENKDALEEQNKAVATDIAKIIQEGLKYGTTLNEHIDLKDYEKTPGMKELIDDYGLTINKNLDINTRIYDSTVDAVNANAAKLKLGNMILDDLVEDIASFQKVEDMRMYLGKQMDNKTIYDIADVNKLIGRIRSGEFEGVSTEEGEQPDIISSTFFEENPAALQYMQDPSYLYGTDTRAPMDVLSKEISTEQAWLNLQQDKESKISGAKPGDINEAEQSFIYTSNIINDNLKAIGDLSASDESVKGLVNAMGGKIEPLTPAESNKMLIDTAAADEYLNQIETKILRALSYGVGNEKSGAEGADEVRKLIKEASNYSASPRVFGAPLTESDKKKRAAVYKLYKMLMPEDNEAVDIRTGFRKDARDNKTVYHQDSTGKLYESSSNLASYKDLQIDVGDEYYANISDNVVNSHRYLNAAFQSWWHIMSAHQEFIPEIMKTIEETPQIDIGAVDEGVSNPEAESLQSIHGKDKISAVDEEDLNTLELLRLVENLRA